MKKNDLPFPKRCPRCGIKFNRFVKITRECPRCKIRIKEVGGD
ncbi:MAG: hypothetical protein PVF58_14130 [Candidatus Methanofastidiosia archaeon]